MIRVGLVDDHPLVRAGLRALLDHAGDITVVGEAAGGASGVELAARERPDVVLMDIRMPGMDGIEATRRITGDGGTPGVQVLLLTAHGTDSDLFAALHAGAAGFMFKDTEPELLRYAVRSVAAGGALLAPSVTRQVMDAAARRTPRLDDPRLALLRERERDVLVELAAGLSDGEIALALHLSPTTVRTYVSRLHRKLGAVRRTQLVVIAYELGVVPRYASRAGPVRPPPADAAGHQPPPP